MFLARAAGLVLVLATPPVLADDWSAQSKQVYDRILGETTLDEQEQLAPGEVRPLKVPPEQQAASPPASMAAELREVLAPAASGDILPGPSYEPQTNIEVPGQIVIDVARFRWFETTQEPIDPSPHR